MTVEELDPTVALLSDVRWGRCGRESVRSDGGDETLGTCVKICWVSDGATAVAAGQPLSSYSQWVWLEWAAVMVAQWKSILQIKVGDMQTEKNTGILLYMYAYMYLFLKQWCIGNVQYWER